MTSKHTPGPWKLDPSWDVMGNTGSGNGMVCSVTNGKFFADGEAEANARLIAAAPDMLDALKGALDRLMSQAEARNYDPPADPEIIANIEWAIAKAEGRS